MIPESLSSSNPTIGKLAKELVERKICRICLSESDQLVDYSSGHKWKKILRTCFAISTVIAEKLPKFVCETCGSFLEKCNEFKQLLKKTELVMITYPLTENLLDKVEVPSWLRAVQKRQLPQEDAVPAKKARISSDDSTEAVQCDQNESEIGTIRVRSNESLQSPTISSEMQPQLSAENMIPSTVIQYCQNPGLTQDSYPTMQPHPQYKLSSAQVVPNQQMKPSYPTLQQQLQQPSSLPPPINSRQYLSTSFTHQVPYYHPQQQQQQQPQQQLQPTFQCITTQQPEMLHQPVQQQTKQPIVSTKPTNRQTIQQPTQPLQTSTARVHCTTCSFVFSSQSHLIHHMRKHLGNAEYHCGCNQRFIQLPEFVQHLKQHTNMMYCGLCGERFPMNTWELAGHLDQHTGAGLQQACDFCPLVFVDQPARLRHVGRQHSDEVRQLMELNPNRYVQ